MIYTMLKPKVDSVEIAPNPVNQNAAYKIQVSVSEIEIILEPIIVYSGTFYCGEDGE